jgi:hypothetical protein
MEQLGVELILANSPQAKGRVERMNGVLQDRLVKALRLAGINDLAAANEFLARRYLPEHNRMFAVKAASPADAHQAVLRRLNDILSWEEERVVQRDWTMAHGGKWYQLDKQHEAMSLAGKKVMVRRLRDGRVQLERGGEKLKWRELAGRPVREKAQRETVLKAVRTASKPAADHPWRMQRVGSVRAALKRRGGVRLMVGDSGRPALRSGLPASPTIRRTGNNNQTRGHFLLSS